LKMSRSSSLTDNSVGTMPSVCRSTVSAADTFLTRVVLAPSAFAAERRVNHFGVKGSASAHNLDVPCTSLSSGGAKVLRMLAQKASRPPRSQTCCSSPLDQLPLLPCLALW
jgi:hypothetical protein